MSACIILMRHHSRFITYYMGKLRFTLTTVLFWIVLVLSCLLSENFDIFGGNLMNGFKTDSAFILTISIIVLLVIYYLFEHKKNKLTFDRILLPSLCIAGLLLVINIFRQGNSRWFISYSRDWDFEFKFPIEIRLLASLEVVIWLVVLYAVVFVYNRFRLNKESYRWVAKLYLIGVSLAALVDLFVEGKDIIDIFNGTYGGTGLELCMGNANVWSLLLFSGVITGILLSYKRFRWYYYVAILGLTVFNTLTTCSTTMYITFAATIIYTLYEIFNYYKVNKSQGRKILFIYVGSVLAGIGLFAMLITLKVPFAYNAWDFVTNSMFNKEFGTLSSRTDIWFRIFELMGRNPLDVILGLGHQTGSLVFREYMGYEVKSAHNAVMEIFLRYGVIGVLVYLGMLGLAVYSFIIHIKKKNYRFVFFYGLCFVCIILHGVTESTTLFTPNVGGLYFGFVFILPVLNILQEKHFNELREDLMATEVSIEKSNIFVRLNNKMLMQIKDGITREENTNER